MQNIEESTQFIFSAIHKNNDTTSENLKKLTSENIFEIIKTIDTLNVDNNSFLSIIKDKNFNAFKIKFGFFSELQIEDNDLKTIIKLLQNYDDELNLSMAVDENGEIVYQMTLDYFKRNFVRDLKDLAYHIHEKIKTENQNNIDHLINFNAEQLHSIINIISDFYANQNEDDVELFGDEYYFVHSIFVKLHSEGYRLNIEEIKYLLQLMEQL